MAAPFNVSCYEDIIYLCVLTIYNTTGQILNQQTFKCILVCNQLQQQEQKNHICQTQTKNNNNVQTGCHIWFSHTQNKEKEPAKWLNFVLKLT